MSSETAKKGFNPFPGLRPFTPGESDLFFGRKGESAEVLSKLLKNRFVTVMGASGTGKSSLIYCGVLPGVRELKSDGSGWIIVSLRPGNDPFGNLAKALADSSKDKTDISQDNPDGIAGMVNSVIKGNENVLLVIDQFEELFRYGSLGNADLSAPARFVDSLVKAVNQHSVNIFTILTMRSDFIGECAHFQGLTQLINESNYLVPHMGRENYREAIEGPVKYAGAKIEQGLVEILLNDIGERTDQLPVLQHAMMRTWTYWQQLDEPDRPIAKSDYDSIGTLSNAMSMHANEAFEELSPSGKVICEKLFKTITDKGSDNKGLRRPTSVRTIMSIAGCQASELYEVIEKFRVPSRSFITPRHNVELTEDSIIDISHESLMRLWDRLREWVEDEASSVQMYLRLSEASAMFQQGKTSLWRPPDLQLAINWRNQHKPTLEWAKRYDPAFERAMVYLRSSEKEYVEEEENKIRLQKRQMRRTKIVAGILGTAAVISLGFMLFAFVQKIAADRQTKLAVEAKTQEERQRALADSNRVLADLQRKLADSTAVIALNNAEEAERQKSLAIIEQRRAIQNEQLAREQEKIAIAQSDSAQRARIRADLNAVIATRQRDTALQLRMLSIGKAMSVKSLQAQGQPDLQTLLAYQAYLFNKRNNGLQNDADIYAGLYNVSRQLGAPSVVSLKGHDQNTDIKSIAFIPGKKEIFTSGSDGKVIRWSLNGTQNSLQVIYSGKNESTKTIEITEVLAVSPDAEWLACGMSNQTIRMIPLQTGKDAFVLKGHTDKIKSVIFSFDSKYLYSAGLDGKVLKWDLTLRTSTNVTDNSMHITSIDISANGHYFAGISTDGSVMVWNPENLNDKFRIETAGKSIKTIKFNPENNLLALGDINGNIELWDINQFKRVSLIKAHDAQINDIQFNSILNQMATAGNDKKLKIFNLQNLTEPPITFTDNEAFVLVMKFSYDGQLIVSGGYEGTDNLMVRPSHVDYFIDDITALISRNMTQNEWNTYVGADIPLEKVFLEKNSKISISAIK
ncbi:MAG TPA: hypothetical protein VK213_05440 [Bacteroidales bacterium]|nr:hypothetical protein [Bacteroidales bacterium]